MLDTATYIMNSNVKYLWHLLKVCSHGKIANFSVYKNTQII